MIFSLRLNFDCTALDELLRCLFGLFGIASGVLLVMLRLIMTSRRIAVQSSRRIDRTFVRRFIVRNLFDTFFVVVEFGNAGIFNR